VWSGAGAQFDDRTLRTAVKEWLQDPAKAIKQYGNITDWNTSKVVDMMGLFRDATSFNQPLLWDTSSVRYMQRMFLFAKSFNQPLPWDTRKVEDMMQMFQGATAFN
jgi:hypothetical protein